MNPESVDEVNATDEPKVSVAASLSDGKSLDLLEGASINLTATSGEFVSTGTSTITRKFKKTGVFEAIWRAPNKPGEVQFQAEVAKEGYVTGKSEETISVIAPAENEPIDPGIWPRSLTKECLSLFL